MLRPRLRIPHAEREEGEVVVCEVEIAALWDLAVFRPWMWLDRSHLIDKFTNVELL